MSKLDEKLDNVHLNSSKGLTKVGLKRAIIAWVEQDIIGEDAKVTDPESDEGIFFLGYNQAKAEQRKKLRA